MKLAFDLRYALRSLRRDGTRTFLAGLCVAFGVLSLVAMQLLTVTLLEGLMFDMRLYYGGDAQVRMAGNHQTFQPADLEQIQTWQEQGLIAGYTPTAYQDEPFLRTKTSGRVSLLMNAIGMEPATYPLFGQLVLREPADKTAAEVLQQPTDALLTQDIANSLGLKIGDQFMLGGGSLVQTWLTLVGTISATPNQQGGTVIYSLATARLLEKRDDVIDAVSIRWGTQPNAQETIVNSPFQVLVATTDEHTSSAQIVFNVMLKGAGVLGLLVGGIGVSNTLQVILARRKLEIAMLKTVGFVRGDLLRLIGLETGFIGVIGGVVGGFAGIAVAGKLIDILNNSGSLMMAWKPDWTIVLGGILAGAATAVVFGLQAILVSSATRPVQLLRELPVFTPWRVWVARLALYGLLVLIFGGLVGLVLGSVVEGIAFVFGGGLLLVVLRTLFWVILWLVLHLPLPRMPMLRLARNNLRNRKTQSSLAVIALFAGTFSIAMAAMSISNGYERVMGQRGSDEGYNLLVLASPETSEQAAAQMVAQGAQQVYTSYSIDGALLDGQPVTISGRTTADVAADVTIMDDTALANWSDDANLALLPVDPYQEQFAVGDKIILQVGDQQRELTISGFYAPPTAANTQFLQPTSAVLVPRQVALDLGGERVQTAVIGAFPVAELDTIADVLGENLTDALVFSKADLNDALLGIYRALLTFAVSVAGLALVAGAVLIANSAGLLIVERRREIGIFKSVGYTSGHVLRLLLSEYGLLGFMGGAFGIIGVAIALFFINTSTPQAQMTFEPLIGAGMTLISVLIALGSAAMVAWQPTRVRPLDVLRYE